MLKKNLISIDQFCSKLIYATKYIPIQLQPPTIFSIYICKSCSGHITHTDRVTDGQMLEKQINGPQNSFVHQTDL